MKNFPPQYFAYSIPISRSILHWRLLLSLIHPTLFPLKSPENGKQSDRSASSWCTTSIPAVIIAIPSPWYKNLLGEWTLTLLHYLWVQCVYKIWWNAFGPQRNGRFVFFYFAICFTQSRQKKRKEFDCSFRCSVFRRTFLVPSKKKYH